MLPTPKHGSWLARAEPELSILTRQACGDYMAKQAEVADRGRAWAAERNAKQVSIDWQFRTEDARIKLKRLYPTIKT